MSLRKVSKEQPEKFEFSTENLKFLLVKMVIVMIDIYVELKK